MIVTGTFQPKKIKINIKNGAFVQYLLHFLLFLSHAFSSWTQIKSRDSIADGPILG